MATQIKLRRDTAANWTNANPTLAQGEPGYDTDNGILKIGDGNTIWSLLPAINTTGGGSGVDGLTSYITDPDEEGDVEYTLTINSASNDGQNIIELRVYESADGENNPGFSLGANNEANHGPNVIAIGNEAVGFNSKQGGVYIGGEAGWNDSEAPQGEFAIAIGYKAARDIALDNSITLNATGQSLNPDESGLFIKPIREEAYDDVTLYYNPTSGEVTYAATAGGGLAPELTKANGNLVASANIVFDEVVGGLAMELDSDGGDNSDQWFSTSTGDADGNTYAVGTNDDGPQYVWKFDSTGAVVWKVGIDDIDGNSVPYTITHDGVGSLIIGIGYYSNNTQQTELAVLVLNASDGTVSNSYLIETSTVGNKYIRDISLLPDGGHIIVGDFTGESILDNDISPVTGTAGSNVNILVVNNSDLSSIPEPWNSNYEVHLDPQDPNAWYWADSVNYFRDLPVTTVSGNGGPQTYVETEDFAEGQLSLVITDAGATANLRLDASWVNGTGQNHLLAQTGTYPFTVVCFPGTFVVGQLAGWTDIGGGIFETPLSVSGVIADGNYDVTSLTINKSQMTVELRYVPTGLTNGPLVGGMIDYSGIQNSGQGYENGDVVKVLGSQMGGVDTITLSGTAYAATINNFLYFSVDDYPGFSVVQNGWRASGPGIDGWATLSNVQNTGAMWRFDLPEDTVSLQPGETYIIDNNGNDITMSLVNQGWGLYINSVSGSVAPAVADTTRFTFSQGVDFRGSENQSSYISGTDYNAGLVRVVGDGITPWLLVVNDTLEDIKSLLTIGETVIVVSGSSTIAVSINAVDSHDGQGNTLYQISDASGLGSNAVDLDSITIPNGTYGPTTWDLRSSLESQAFIHTPVWQHTFGSGNYESFNSVVYDSFDGSIYAHGEFNNGENELILFKFDAETGNTIWSKYVEDNEGTGNNAGSVVVDGLGSIYLCSTNDNGDTIVSKLTSEGNLVWQSVQMASDNWNNQPGCVLDSNGDIIVAGSYYNSNDSDNDEHNVWSFMKLSKDDGSLVWARYFDNVEGVDMYDMNDNDVNVISIVNDTIHYAGQAYDTNDNRYIALAVKLESTGVGLGTYGRWEYKDDPNAAWVDNTNNAVVVSATITAVDQASFSFNTQTPISVTADAVGTLTARSTVIGGAGGLSNVREVAFEDGSSVATAGIARHSVDTGDVGITLSASMNGKFRYYNNDTNSWSSTIYIPSNADVELPIGFVLTVVIGNFNGQTIYVNNNGNSDVIIRGSGTSDEASYWGFGGDSNYGVYTIMKVDTNTWMLAGPNVWVD